MGGGGNKIDSNDGKRRTKDSKELSKKEEIYHSRGEYDGNADESGKVALQEEKWWRKEKEKAKAHTEYDKLGDGKLVSRVQNPPILTSKQVHQKVLLRIAALLEN